jgi:putative sterol carrier protein
MSKFIRVFGIFALFSVAICLVFVGCSDNDKGDKDNGEAPNIVRAEFHLIPVQASVWDPTLNGGAGGIRLTGQTFIFDWISITYGKPVDNEAEEQTIALEISGTTYSLMLKKQNSKINTNETQTISYTVSNNVDVWERIFNGERAFIRNGEQRVQLMEHQINPCAM